MINTFVHLLLDVCIPQEALVQPISNLFNTVELRSGTRYPSLLGTLDLKMFLNQDVNYIAWTFLRLTLLLSTILVYNVSFPLFYVNQVENKLCMLNPIICDKDILHKYVHAYILTIEIDVQS